MMAICIKSGPSEVSYLSPILVLGLHTSLVFQQSLKTNYITAK